MIFSGAGKIKRLQSDLKNRERRIAELEENNKLLQHEVLSQLQLLQTSIEQVSDKTKSGSGPQRKAMVSCITDNFVGLGATFLASLVENGGLKKDVDIILLTDPIYAPLSSENRDMLRRICPKVRFVEPDTSFLSDDLVKRWENGVVIKANIDRSLPNKKSVYIKLCILRMTHYDAILWLDSDVLVLKPVNELLSLPASLGMVRGVNPHHHFGVSYGKHRKGFNSGVMLVKKPHLSERSFAQAVVLLNEKQHTTKQDQSLLNFMWKDEDRMYLPHHYNWKVGLLKTDEEWNEAFSHARVIHFDGPCKWKLKEGSRDNLTTAAFHEIREKYEIPMIMEP